jgi:hypothetical protein
MIVLKQDDYKWKDLELAKGVTIGDSGCYLTCLSMLVEKTPDIVLKILKAKKAINSQGMLLHPADGLALGFKKYSKELLNYKPTLDCIAETDFYAPNYPQHFFVVLANGSICDPLKGEIEAKNKYEKNIRSYRVYA